MKTSKAKQSIAEIIAENKINISWYGKCMWISKFDPRLSDSKTATELMVKLEDGVGTEETIIEGLRLLGIEVVDKSTVVSV